MFHRRERSPWIISLDIARDISRRGVPAKAKTITVMSAAGNVRARGIVVPGRGIAAISNDLNIIVVSKNKPLPWAMTFEYKSVEAAAENILRNLPLP